MSIAISFTVCSQPFAPAPLRADEWENNDSFALPRQRRMAAASAPRPVSAGRPACPPAPGRTCGAGPARPARECPQLRGPPSAQDGRGFAPRARQRRQASVPPGSRPNARRGPSAASTGMPSFAPRARQRRMAAASRARARQRRHASVPPGPRPNVWRGPSAARYAASSSVTRSPGVTSAAPGGAAAGRCGAHASRRPVERHPSTARKTPPEAARRALQAAQAGAARSGPPSAANARRPSEPVPSARSAVPRAAPGMPVPPPVPVPSALPCSAPCVPRSAPKPPPSARSAPGMPAPPLFSSAQAPSGSLCAVRPPRPPAAPAPAAQAAPAHQGSERMHTTRSASLISTSTPRAASASESAYPPCGRAPRVRS